MATKISAARRAVWISSIRYGISPNHTMSGRKFGTAHPGHCGFVAMGASQGKRSSQARHQALRNRSEERRVGKECRARWGTEQKRKKEKAERGGAYTKTNESGVGIR